MDPVRTEQSTEVDDQFLPEEAVCGDCDKLIRGAPGLAQFLAARGLAYLDSGNNEMVVRSGINYCRCTPPPTPVTPTPGESTGLWMNY